MTDTQLQLYSHIHLLLEHLVTWLRNPPNYPPKKITLS